MKIYEEKKQILKEKMSKSCQRICITTDMWTFVQTLVYLSLTVHFIDDEWKLHKKIINFCMIPSLHTGENIANVIVKQLMDSNMDRLCTITLDNSSTNDVVVRNLREQFSSWGMLLQDGSLFHVCC